MLHTINYYSLQG